MKTPPTRDLENYLYLLSERVRALRAQRGISRRTLSKLTGISERYLAQVEGGEANPSVDVLWRIAEALDVTMHELTADRPATVIRHPELRDLLRSLPVEKQRAAYSVLMQYFAGGHRDLQGVVLLGLRGAGKSTLGRLISAELEVPFVRLRQVIEELAGADLPTVFALGGQKAYRRLEREAVDYVLEHHRGALIEAGGSIVADLETFNTLRAGFFAVWVRASPQEHVDRVVRQGELRILQSTDEAMADLQRILAEREPYYSIANYTVETTGRTAEDCAKELADVCQPYLRPLATASK